MSKDLTENLGELNGVVKGYVRARIDLLKLTILEKTAEIVTYIFSFIVITLFAILILAFAAAAFALWYGNTFDDYVTGVLIATGVLVLLAILVVLFRHVLITNNATRNLSNILFKDEKE